MQPLTRRPPGRLGAPLAIRFGLLAVCACGTDRSAAIPAATASRSAATPGAARAGNAAVKIAGPCAGPFDQVTFDVDVLVTANQAFEP
jgi:hypothetical protein